jgi:hypothetical protein
MRQLATPTMSVSGRHCTAGETQPDVAPHRHPNITQKEQP